MTAATPESLGSVCQFWRTEHFCGLGCEQDWWVLLCIPGFPKLFVGELLEFPDLLVAKVDYRYHNFPFCSWVCLLSSSDKTFRTKDSLNQHLKTHEKPVEIKCTMCTGVFYSKSSLNSHIKAKHEKIRHLCPYCKKDFTSQDYYTKHIRTCMNDIPMSCEKCGDTFKNVSLLHSEYNIID